MIKRLIKIAVALLILIVIGVVALIFSIDSIARWAVEKSGTYVLGVQTKLSSMSIGLVNPSATMGGLDVANPSGFSDPSFMALTNGSLSLDVKSVMSDVVRVPSIKLSGISVNFEQVADKSNATVILANMKNAVGGGSSSPSQPSSGSGKKFVIDDLLIENINISAKASGLPVSAPPVKLKIDKIELKSLGNGGKDPIGMDQLTAIIMNAIMQAAMEAGASQFPQQMVAGVLGGLSDMGKGLPKFDLSMDTGGGLKQLGDVGDLAKKVGVDLGALSQKATGDVTKKVEEGIGDAKKKVEDATKGVGDLFKKK